MNKKTEDNLPAGTGEIFGELQKNWGWLMLFGIVSIILGTIGMGMIIGLTLASVLFFGVLLVVGGTFQLVQAFKCRGWKSEFWHVLNALLYIAAGLLIIINPAMASATLTLFIAGILVAVGLLRIIIAVQMRHSSGWGWPFAAGLISIALGAMIFAHWPASGLWVIGLFVAIELIFNGWGYLFVALAARRVGKVSGHDDNHKDSGSMAA